MESRTCRSFLCPIFSNLHLKTLSHTHFHISPVHFTIVKSGLYIKADSMCDCTSNTFHMAKLSILHGFKCGCCVLKINDVLEYNPPYVQSDFKCNLHPFWQYSFMPFTKTWIIAYLSDSLVLTLLALKILSAISVGSMSIAHSNHAHKHPLVGSSMLRILLRTSSGKRFNADNLS